MRGSVGDEAALEGGGGELALRSIRGYDPDLQKPKCSGIGEETEMRGEKSRGGTKAVNGGRG